jgi:hypothetical protein
MLGRGGKGFVATDADGPLHESLTKAWWPAELIPKRHYNSAEQKWERRMNNGRRRTIPPAPMVHESVFRRSGGYASRLPADAIQAPWVPFTTGSNQ